MSRDIPIIFSAPMVKALLEGRKTQTRRLLRLPTKGEYVRPDMGGWEATTVGGGSAFTLARDGHRVAAPEQVAIWNQTTGTTIVARYQAGDRLWVRENWAPADRFYQDHTVDPPRVVAYRADKSALNLGQPVPAYDIAQWNWAGIRWTPSIHMPRWASRLTLAVTGVKIEKLQDITEEDAKAEGIEPYVPDSAIQQGPNWYRMNFRDLWKSIHPEKVRVKIDDDRYEMRDNPSRWDANPWVVAPCFKVVTANIDASPVAA